MHLNSWHDQHENQGNGSTKTKHHHKGQCFHKHWCISLLQSDQLKVRLLQSPKFQWSRSWGHLCNPQKHLWTICASGFTVKKTINFRWHRETSRPVCRRMGCRCNYYIYLRLSKSSSRIFSWARISRSHCQALLRKEGLPRAR